MSTSTTAAAAVAAAAPVSPASRSIVTPGGGGAVAACAGGIGVDQRHHAARTHVPEAVGRQPGHEIGRRVVGGRRPDVRLSPDRGEEDEDLGETPIEGVGLGRPADPLEPVPERLGLDRVVQQDRIAQVAQVAVRDRVDPRFMEEQATHRRRVDHRAHDSGGNRPATAGVR